jgi:hypothetical protein
VIGMMCTSIVRIVGYVPVIKVPVFMHTLYYILIQIVNSIVLFQSTERVNSTMVHIKNKQFSSHI